MCQKSGRSERAGSQGPAKSAHNARSRESILSRTSWKREAKSVTLTHVHTLSLALSRSLAACGPAKRRPQQLGELVRGHDGSGCEAMMEAGANFHLPAVLSVLVKMEGCANTCSIIHSRYYSLFAD